MAILNKCPYCKKELNDKSNICPYCGGVFFEVVGHKHSPTVNVSNTQTSRDKPRKKESYLGGLYGNLNSMVGDIAVGIKAAWNSIGHIPKFIGLIILISLIASIFPNNDIATTSSYNNTPKKVEEAILPENRLSNGTVIYKDSQYLSDDHQITIDNSAGGTDAIVKLVSTIKNSSIYTVYVRDGYKYTINNIGNGSYSLYFAYCKGYNYTINKPLGLYGSQKADRLYTFQTREEGDYLVSSQLTITLYKAYDGNLTTTSVGEDQFNGY